MHKQRVSGYMRYNTAFYLAWFLLTFPQNFELGFNVNCHKFTLSWYDNSAHSRLPCLVISWVRSRLRCFRHLKLLFRYDVSYVQSRGGRQNHRHKDFICLWATRVCCLWDSECRNLFVQWRKTDVKPPFFAVFVYGSIYVYVLRPLRDPCFEDLQNSITLEPSETPDYRQLPG